MKNTHPSIVPSHKMYGLLVSPLQTSRSDFILLPTFTFPVMHCLFLLFSQVFVYLSISTSSSVHPVISTSVTCTSGYQYFRYLYIRLSVLPLLVHPVDSTSGSFTSCYHYFR